VVVAAGLILVEPLTDVDVNVPGVMATLVASAAAQLSVLLAPEPMLAGSAVKEVIVGTEPFSGGALDEVVEPQPASPAQANRMRTSEQRSSPGKWSPGELRILQDESVESVRNPKQTQSIAHRELAVALRGPSPLGPPASFVHQVLRVIGRSTVDVTSRMGDPCRKHLFSGIRFCNSVDSVLASQRRRDFGQLRCAVSRAKAPVLGSQKRCPC